MSIDFMTKLPKSKDPVTRITYNLIMVIVDRFTKYLIVVCCGLYCTVLSEYRIRARGGRRVGSRRREVSRSVKGFGGTWWW